MVTIVDKLFKPNKQSFDEFLELHWNRLQSIGKLSSTNITRDTKFNNSYSFNDIVDIYRKRKDRQATVNSIELLAEDIDMSLGSFEDLNMTPNFSDVIPRVIKQNYVETADKMLCRLKTKKGLKIDPTYFHNLPSASAKEELIKSRDIVFETIKKRNITNNHNNHNKNSSNIIDISDVTYSAYNSIRGILSYSKTINDPNYILGDAADELFREICSNIGPVSSAHLLFPGTAFLETEWAKQLEWEGTRHDVRLYDASRGALLMYYLFSDYTARNIHDVMDREELLSNISKDNRHKHLLIQHNAIHSNNADYIEKEMKDLKKYSNVKIFYTIPSVDCQTLNHYGSGNDYFTKNFLDEVLLCKDSNLIRFDDIKPTGSGYMHIPAFRAESDVLLRNQYCDDSILLKKGTIIHFSKSNRFSHDLIKHFAHISGRELSYNDKGVYALH